MVPRLITYQGSIEKSVCPFCGGTYKDFSKCFIATAVYGSPYATEVIVLRKFRDNYLLNSVAGRFLVKVYYLISPKIVKIIQESNNTRIILKKFLDYIVKHMTTAYR